MALVQVISRPADAGVTVSGFSRVANWITGSEKGNEPLIKPFGLALDERDNLLITDTGANAVSYFDRTRKAWQRWQKTGGSPSSVAATRRCVVISRPKRTRWRMPWAVSMEC